jgi:hypothetical protein
MAVVSSVVSIILTALNLLVLQSLVFISSVNDDTLEREIDSISMM